MGERIEKKATFNLVPSLYDEIRPRYPVSVLEAIEKYAALGASSRILEVGPGTGQASEYFIRAGYSFTGIDLGHELIRFCVEKYKEFDNAAFIHSTFEEWRAGDASFDLILAAQSFHWVDPSYGIGKVAALLRSGGTIALLWNLDESQDTDFWRKSGSLHEKYLPTVPGNQGMDLKGYSERFYEVLSSSPSFARLERLEQSWNVCYSADEWIKMRNTFSADLQLSQEARDAFHAELRRVIEELGGSFTRSYRTVCLLAQTEGM